MINKDTYKRLTNIGDRYGNVVVLSFKYKKDGRDMWECQCDCGKIFIARGSNLRSGNTKSCGCNFRKNARLYHIKHNNCNSRLYHIWHSIKQRCLDKNRPEYNRYGGRGITICNEWINDFQAFYDWAMANGYQDNLSIDRIDNDRGYFPENCRFVTRDVQQNNTRYNHKITIDGETKNITQWAREYNLNVSTLWLRIKKGWSKDRLLIPSKKRKLKAEAEAKLKELQERNQ